MKHKAIRLAPAALKRLRLEVAARDGGRCRCCGRRTSLHAHHIVFKSRRGDDASYNLIMLCMDCHNGVHLIHINNRGKVVITALDGNPDSTVNADEGVRFHLVDGWQPLYRRT